MLERQQGDISDGCSGIFLVTQLRQLLPEPELREAWHWPLLSSKRTVQVGHKEEPPPDHGSTTY